MTRRSPRSDGGPLPASVAAVVPAAGASRRMGTPKPLLPFGDGTVAGSVVDALVAGGAGEVALVAAPGDRELAAWGRERGLTVAVNPAPERGMLSSIRCGVDALGGAGDLARRRVALLVTPADLPALAAATVERVVRALSGGAPLAVPVHAGRRGHPLGIAPSLVAEVAELDLGEGLRQLLRLHAGEVVEVQVDDAGAVHDVDTPADYRRVAGRALPGEGED